MNKKILSVWIVWILATLACSFTVDLPEIKTGSEVSYPVHQSLPNKKTPVEVELDAGAATLNVTGGAKSLVDGTIVTNVPEWEPKVGFSDDRLTISQPGNNISGIPSKSYKNVWNLALSDDIPLDLTIIAGAYQGHLDLGGLNLTNLAITDGAGNSEMSFSKPNQGEMEQFKYTSGASSVKLYDLANANFQQMKFSAGAGDYTLDFSGDLKHDIQVDMEAGMSAVTIIVPSGSNASVTVNGEMKDVNTNGAWSVNDQTYTTTGGNGPLISIQINMNLGVLHLSQGDTEEY